MREGAREGERKREQTFRTKVLKMQYLRNKKNIFPLCPLNVHYIARVFTDVLLYFLGD